MSCTRESANRLAPSRDLASALAIDSRSDSICDRSSRIRRTHSAPSDRLKPPSLWLNVAATANSLARERLDGADVVTVRCADAGEASAQLLEIGVHLHEGLAGNDAAEYLPSPIERGADARIHGVQALGVFAQRHAARVRDLHVAAALRHIGGELLRERPRRRGDAGLLYAIGSAREFAAGRLQFIAGADRIDRLACLNRVLVPIDDADEAIAIERRRSDRHGLGRRLTMVSCGTVSAGTTGAGSGENRPRSKRVV